MEKTSISPGAKRLGVSGDLSVCAASALAHFGHRATAMDVIQSYGPSVPRDSISE